MKKKSTLKDYITSTELIIMLLIFLIGAVPEIVKNMTDTKNAKGKNYGVYTIEEIKTLEIEDPFIEKISLQKDFYQKYFSKQFDNVEVEETIYCISDGMSGRLIIEARNEDKPGIEIYVHLNKNKTDLVTIRLLYFHNGNFKETFSFINKEELVYVADYFNIKDAYTLLQNNYNNLSQSSYNENHYYANKTDEHYNIKINESRYSPKDPIEAEYTIEKTF
jgi:hypothetical protein